MTKNLISLLFLLLAVNGLMAQTAVHDATIAPVNQDPHSSSVFDAKSTDKGMLVPRVALTTGSGSASPVTSPATSLLIYNTVTVGDVTPGYYYWNGSAWVRLMSSNNTPTGAGATDKVAFWVSDTELGQNANFHWDNTNGRLGIGNAAPTQPLHVTGNARVTGNLVMANTTTITSGRIGRFANGTAAAPAYSFTNSTTTGMFLPVANELSLSTNSTERVRIGTTGTVQLNAYTTNGIVRTTAGNGTLTSGGAINLTSEVTGILPIANGGTGSSAQNWVDLTTAQSAAGIKTWTSQANFSNVLRASNGTAAAPTYAFTNSTGLGIYRAGVDILGISTAGTERLRILANGNIGAGAITTPAQLLHIGSQSDAETASQVMRIESNGFAGLELYGDRSNAVSEPGGAYVRLSQDLLAVQGIFGVVNVAGRDGSGNTFTGTEGNSVVLGNKYAGALHLGTSNTVRFTLASNGTARLHTYTTNGILRTTGANGTLSSTGGAVTVPEGGTGATALTGVVIGNGAAAMTAVAGTASQYLRRNAANTAYEFVALTPAVVGMTNLTFNNGGAGAVSGTVYNGGTAQTISYNTIGAVGGSGTTNYVSKFTGANTLGNSQIFDNGTNVGIGNAAPGAKFDVTGDMRGSNNMSLTAGDGKGYRLWDSDSYKIYMSATSNATWGGDLGSSSDYNMYFRMAGGTNRGWVFRNNTTNVAAISSNGNFWMRGTSPTIYFRDQDNPAYFIHANSDRMYFLHGATDGTTWNTNRPLTLYQGNKVGINAETPGFALTIGGTGNVLAVDNQSQFAARNSGGTYETFMWPRWSDNIMYMNYGTGGMHIRNNASVSTMFLTNANNVGIGTTAPAYKLEVAGNINATTTIRAASTITNGGFDFLLGNTDQVSRGNSGASRALVKDGGNVLTLNYAGDFTGGTRVGSLAGAGSRVVYADANGTLSAGAGKPCPAVNFETAYTFDFTHTRLCIYSESFNNNWNLKSNDCINFYQGAQMCTHQQVRRACALGMPVLANKWLADLSSDDAHFRTNGTGCDNFDGTAGRGSSYGVYCCLEFQR
jgi:hypothetical protein